MKCTRSYIKYSYVSTKNSEIEKNIVYASPSSHHAQILIRDDVKLA